MSKVFSGLGSNVDDRETYIREAVAAICRIERTCILHASSLYETEPWGYRDQKAFLNQVIALETPLDPMALLKSFQRIESDLDRVRKRVWGPRTIDIDILLFDDLIIRTPELQIPHPRLARRRFVLIPLAEIDPGLRLPDLDLTVREALDICKDRGDVKLYKQGLVSGGSCCEC